MKNKVDIFTTDYGHREAIKKDDHADEPDPSGRKLPQITDPIRPAERINVQGYLKMFLLFTSDMKIMFSGKTGAIIASRGRLPAICLSEI